MTSKRVQCILQKLVILNRYKFAELEHRAIFDRWISTRLLLFHDHDLTITFSRILSRSRFRYVMVRPPFSRSFAQVPHLPCACAATHARFNKLSWTKCHERFVSSPCGAPVCKVRPVVPVEADEWRIYVF